MLNSQEEFTSGCMTIIIVLSVAAALGFAVGRWSVQCERCGTAEVAR